MSRMNGGMDAVDALQMAAYLGNLQTEMKARGRSEEEISRCVGYARTLLRSGLPVLFDSRHVRKVLQLDQIRQQAYHVFFLHQRGKLREITAPSLPLKSRQRWIAQHILSQLPVSPHAHGFVKSRSIKTNALLHAHHDYVLCMDIEDFFPSIPLDAVVRVFARAGYSKSASAALAQLCCHRDVLPQGAPTSPSLANLIFSPVDEELAALAGPHGAVYSRYADDLTFSSDTALDRLEPAVHDVLQRHGYLGNRRKTAYFRPGQPKRIPGLTVQNGSVRIPRKFKRALRQEIHFCRKFGVFTHLQNIHAAKCVNYREYLYGKAYYVRMIEPEEGERFLRELDGIAWPVYYL